MEIPAFLLPLGFAGEIPAQLIAQPTAGVLLVADAPGEHNMRAVDGMMPSQTPLWVVHIPGVQPDSCSPIRASQAHPVPVPSASCSHSQPATGRSCRKQGLFQQ